MLDKAEYRLKLEERLKSVNWTISNLLSENRNYIEPPAERVPDTSDPKPGRLRISTYRNHGPLTKEARYIVGTFESEKRGIEEKLFQLDKEPGGKEYPDPYKRRTGESTKKQKQEANDTFREW